jgi:hypothetical protein
MFIEDAFRPHWAHGLNNISINRSTSISDWIKTGNEYQIHQQVSQDEFILNVYNRSLFLSPISQDCNRFSTASLESVMKIDDDAILPKNLSWVLIKQYYSAFYAAHLILRLLGLSLSQLDAPVISKVKNVANLYGFLNGINVENGYYLLNFSNPDLALRCKKINVNQDGGSHVALWKIFGNKMRELSLDMLANNTDVGIQDICRKLDELVANLDYVGAPNHSWLSKMRNELNYKHYYGVWHPYTLPKDQLEKIKREHNLWRNDVLQIELRNYTGKELLRFSSTCLFIIGLANKLCEDMSKRCSNGKSFLSSGYLQIINT